jgi:7-cyano-7-deazaguanine reductase
MSEPLMAKNPENSELGKKSEYDSRYNPGKLFPMLRQLKRDEIGITAATLPFYGFDLWNHYEVSWLRENGRPDVALAQLKFPCDSPHIIESKSLKLYFNSLNNTSFKDAKTVELVIQRDLTECAKAPVQVKIIPLHQFYEETLYRSFSGICLDDLDIKCSVYQVDTAFLTTSDEQVLETVYSDLLKSTCLVTQQPDWGSVQITYKGNKINHEGLLRYIISFRHHHEFNEQCIERIFMDIKTHCQPEELTVFGRYTRRGGMDINPYRSTKPAEGVLGGDIRLCRQ